MGFWELTFHGRRAILKHQQGLYYVAYLLTHPRAEPIHALDLAARVRAASRQARPLELTDPNTGQLMAADASATLHERSLKLDQAETMRSVLRQQRELEAILDDDTQIEPVKAEAARELVHLYDYEKKHSQNIRDAAGKAADAVGRALHRLHNDLATAARADGSPEPVLRAFAQHLYMYLLVPSGRDGGHGGFRARHAHGGAFTYQPPHGLTWSS